MTSLEQLMRKHLLSDGENLIYFVNHAKQNKRKALSMDDGPTPVQGHKWRSDNIVDLSEPGHMDAPSKKWSDFFFDVNAFVAQDVFPTVFKEEFEEMSPDPTSIDARCFIEYPTLRGREKHQIIEPTSNRLLNLCEENTANMGNRICFHFDELNDPRRHRNFICFNSIFIDVSQFLNSDQVDHLHSLSIDPTNVKFTMLGTTRRTCGDKTAQTKHGVNEEDGAVKKYLEHTALLKNRQKGSVGRSLLDHETATDELFVVELQENSILHPDCITDSTVCDGLHWP